MKRKQFISKFWVLHGDSQYKGFSNQVFTRILNRQLLENGSKGGMILKAGDEYTREIYISLLRASKSTVTFGNKPWSEYMKIFYSYTSLKHYERLFTTITEFFFGNGYF